MDKKLANIFTNIAPGASNNGNLIFEPHTFLPNDWLEYSPRTEGKPETSTPELQADFFSVKVLEKFASFKLFQEARLGNIGGLQRFRALICDSSDIYESLDRFRSQLWKGPQLRHKVVVHGIHGYRLIAGKILLQDREAVVAPRYKIMNCGGVGFHEAPHGIFVFLNK